MCNSPGFNPPGLTDDARVLRSTAGHRGAGTSVVSASSRPLEASDQSRLFSRQPPRQQGDVARVHGGQRIEDDRLYLTPIRLYFTTVFSEGLMMRRLTISA